MLPRLGWMRFFFAFYLNSTKEKKGGVEWPSFITFYCDGLQAIATLAAISVIKFRFNFHSSGDVKRRVIKSFKRDLLRL